jgi:hypothetical protein
VFFVFCHRGETIGVGEAVAKGILRLPVKFISPGTIHGITSSAVHLHGTRTAKPGDGAGPLWVKSYVRHYRPQ